MSWRAIAVRMVVAAVQRFIACRSRVPSSPTTHCSPRGLVCRPVRAHIPVSYTHLRAHETSAHL
eukprot:9973296-Alexandrium_andersonii.AAC.1